MGITPEVQSPPPAPAAPVTPVLVRPCFFREQGCLFVGLTEQDALVHGETCGYNRLLKHVELLLTQISQRDREIARLNSLLISQQKVATPSPVSSAQQVLDSFKHFMDKIDEDGMRMFNNTKESLSKTKSTAYQTSLQALQSIKEAMEVARLKFVAMLNELEVFAKQKVRSILTQTQKAIEFKSQNPTITITTTTITSEHPSPSTPPTLPPPSVSMPFPIPEGNTSNNSCPPTPVVSQQSSNVDVPAGSDVSPQLNGAPAPRVESDEDLKDFLEVSKQEYLKEQEARMAEEESIRQAMRLSLIDFEDYQNNKQM